jgi:hypothetical protein
VRAAPRQGLDAGGWGRERAAGRGDQALSYPVAPADPCPERAGPRGPPLHRHVGHGQRDAQYDQRPLGVAGAEATGTLTLFGVDDTQGPQKRVRAARRNSFRPGMPSRVRCAVSARSRGNPSRRRAPYEPPRRPRPASGAIPSPENALSLAVVITTGPRGKTRFFGEIALSTQSPKSVVLIPKKCDSCPKLAAFRDRPDQPLRHLSGRGTIPAACPGGKGVRGGGRPRAGRRAPRRRAPARPPRRRTPRSC